MPSGIKFDKRSKTKTSNNSYDISVKEDGKKKVIGSYNQLNNKLMLDLWKFITLYSKGIKCSKSFNNIFIKITGHFSVKKNLKIKY